MPSTRTSVIALLGLRIAYGAGLVVAPTALTKRWLGPVRLQGGTQVALRGMGAREVLLHVGALLATVRGDAVRPWLAASAIGDLADILATVAASDDLPEGSPRATVAVAGGSALLSVLAGAAVDA